MKLTRRDFLKDGAITALALAVGLKPNKVIRSPVVPLKHFTKGYLVSGGDFLDSFPHDRDQIARAFRMPPSQALTLGDLTKDQYDRAYGGAAGGGKTGYGGFLVPPEFYTILLQGGFLEGDPNDPPLTCFGFSVIPTEKLKEVQC